VLLDQILEQHLPLDLRLFSQISAVQPEQIEGEVDQSILIASAVVCLQLGEVRAPIMDDDDLAVDDGLSFDIEGGRNPRELLGLLRARQRDPRVASMLLEAASKGETSIDGLKQAGRRALSDAPILRN
jgi:hypothetical protein